jgi:HAD superfamily hydrolase (TIGR01509 family)
MSALLFGSISTLADTSELQRQAFNDAFAQHGLDWTWERGEYAAGLVSNGGVDRVAAYAAGRGETVDAQLVHATKSELFCKALADAAQPARPGVLDTIARARKAGIKVGLVTTTSAENVSALLGAVAGLDAGDFDLVVDASQVSAPKPDPAAYAFALRALDERADACVAIEDNVGGLRSADSAGVRCVAFPNANTAGHDFGAAQSVVDALDPAAVLALVAS